VLADVLLVDVVVSVNDVEVLELVELVLIELDVELVLVLCEVDVL
jgi:hypothetical protein